MVTEQGGSAFAPGQEDAHTSSSLHTFHDDHTENKLKVLNVFFGRFEHSTIQIKSCCEDGRAWMMKRWTHPSFMCLPFAAMYYASIMWFTLLQSPNIWLQPTKNQALFRNDSSLRCSSAMNTSPHNQLAWPMVRIQRQRKGHVGPQWQHATFLKILNQSSVRTICDAIIRPCRTHSLLQAFIANNILKNLTPEIKQLKAMLQKRKVGNLHPQSVFCWHSIRRGTDGRILYAQVYRFFARGTFVESEWLGYRLQLNTPSRPSQKQQKGGNIHITRTKTTKLDSIRQGLQPIPEHLLEEQNCPSMVHVSQFCKSNTCDHKRSAQNKAFDPSNLVGQPWFRNCLQ